jgi:hypothetical protein
LADFIGQALPPSVRAQSNGWRYTFSAETTTGHWFGFALHQESHADGMLDLYRQCLLLRLDGNDIITTATLADVVTVAHRALGLSSWTTSENNVVAISGTGELGEALPRED